MPVTFEPTEEQRMMRDTVAELAKAKLRAKAREIEAARKLPDDVKAAVVELGLGGLWIPEAYGGAGVSPRTAVLVEEELAFGDAGAAYAIPGPAHVAHALMELADDAQRARFFAPFVEDPTRYGGVAFSEARPKKERAGFVTTAKKHGDRWVIDGAKSFVLNAGIAATYVVFAQIEEEKGWEGIGAFVVDANAKGVKVGARHATVGLDAATFGEVAFERVEVADADRLLGGGDFVAASRRFFARVSIQAAARAVGVARAGWQLARDYADERKAFGKPIAHFQALAFMISDRLIDLDGARGLVWRAAWTLEGAGSEHWKKKNDSTRELLLRSSEAFAEASEVAVRCGDDAIQVHGGAGFVRDYLAEKAFRDAKQIALCAPSSATSDALFSSIVLGAPLDAATTLPVPEIQPIFV